MLAKLDSREVVKGEHHLKGKSHEIHRHKHSGQGGWGSLCSGSGVQVLENNTPVRTTGTNLRRNGEKDKIFSSARKVKGREEERELNY